MSQIIEHKLELTQYAHKNELEEKFIRLIDTAIEAAGRAYAPYSKFHVGASILLMDGSIVSGNNQENASYPIGTCAERVALNYLMSQKPKSDIEAIAVYAESEQIEIMKPVSPCGMCRQAMLEVELNQKSQIRFFMASPKHEIHSIDRISDLLPFGFDLSSLKK